MGSGVSLSWCQPTNELRQIPGQLTEGPKVSQRWWWWPARWGGPRPDPFQMTACTLGLRVWESCVHPLGAESPFPRVLWASRMYDALLAFKDRGSGGSSSHGRPQGCGAYCGTQTPSLLGGIPAAAIIFSFAGHPPRGMCPSYTPTLSLLPAASQGWCQAASR